MVFSSVPPYFDHHNWHHQLQHSNHQQGSGGGGGENLNLTPPPPCGGGGGGGGEGSNRPRSMVERARLAKLPLPEPGLNCPRCDSTNTKFCYFNNYNLKQPRHFCKTCRRYWTCGGALRNVPVGGGCRRNKRNHRNNRRSSKSPTQTRPKSASVSPQRAHSTENMTSAHLPQLPSLHLPFMSSQYGGVGGNISPNIGGFHAQNEMGSFQLGNGSSNGNSFNNILSIGGGESWRLPFLAGFEAPHNANLFHYQSEGVAEAQSCPLGSGDVPLTSSQAADPPVKVEENRGINLRRFLGTNQQQWMGNTWAEFSGSSTPTTHFL